MAGEIIRQGDRTSHGGVVLEGSLFDICHGKPIAFVGHQVFCPKCKGMFPIIEGVPTTTFYGKGVAIAGMKTACGASLIPTQFTDIVERGGGAAPAAQALTREEGATPGHAIARAAGKHTQNAAGKNKVITRLFWTYGPDESPLVDISRHYVDLNLHVEAENYLAGEIIQITVDNDDQTKLIPDVGSIRIQCVIGPGGKAKVMNVFKDSTVHIGVIS